MPRPQRHIWGLADAAREVKEQGTFTYLDRSMTTLDLNGFLQG